MASEVFDRFVRAVNLKVAVQKLSNEDLFELGAFVGLLGDGGVPGLVRALVSAEKIRRWDDHYKKHVTDLTGLTIDDLPAGATAAEGMDAAHRGEEF